MEEKKLVERIKNRDESAFRELVENYQDMVINTCYGLLNDYNEAEDVAQDVFVEVYESINKFRGDSKIFTWLYRIAINKSINASKKNKFRKFFTRIEDAFNGVETNDYEKSNDINTKPLRRLELIEDKQIIKRALENLPNNQKVAFTLHKYEDISYKEIAEIMNLSLSSVESLIFRAKQNLKKKLIQYFIK